MRTMSAFLCLFSFALMLMSPPAAAASATVQGQVRVIDGDTVALGHQRIRFFGVDAPESSQVCDEGDRAWRCGAAARDMLAEQIGARHHVTCEVKDRDPYGRLVAVCFNDQGEDLNAWMVKQGLAVAYTRYSRAYARDESWARERGNGVWGGPFERPDVYRHHQQDDSDTASFGGATGGMNAAFRAALNEGTSIRESMDTEATPVQRPTMRGMACVILHKGC